MPAAHAFANPQRHYEEQARSGPHHPSGRYTPNGFRHYHRREVLFAVLRWLTCASVLDVGCSDGYFAREIARDFDVNVVGVDLAPTAVRRAMARSVAGVAADGSALPFNTGAFDLVMSTETLEHVFDAPGFVQELRRVARHWVVVTTPVGHGERPDWRLEREGHVHSFDRVRLERLFGAGAMVTSYRANATFALYAGLGRWLGSRIGSIFIKADLAVAARFGSESSRLVPLRHRSFMVVAPAG